MNGQLNWKTFITCALRHTIPLSRLMPGFWLGMALLMACASKPTTPAPAANLPNPASVYCEQHGNKLEIRTAEDGSQSGACLFPDGSECDEWAFYRGECAPASQNAATPSPLVKEAAPTIESTIEATPAAVVPTEFPTPLPFSLEDYQGWWTYTHTSYGFTIQLPEDWVVEETSTFDPLMSGHSLSLHPEEIAPGVRVENVNIRMTFRNVGEDALLWPTGVGEGEFIQQGTLDVAGQPARRVLLVCPTGEVTSIYYQGDAQANIPRGDLEFGFIFSAGSHCEPGFSLDGKIQRAGEMIIASLNVP